MSSVAANLGLLWMVVNLDDEHLAGVLNYLVFDIGAGCAPAGAKPYSAKEVGRLRRAPLSEVSLVAVRRDLVETLVTPYGASVALREYGGYGRTDNAGCAHNHPIRCRAS